MYVFQPKYSLWAFLFHEVVTFKNFRLLSPNFVQSKDNFQDLYIF